MRDSPALIEISPAIDMVGRGLYGADWIGCLSKRDTEIRATLGPQRAGDLPVMIAPCPPGRAADLDRALGREVRMAAQRNTALDWIFSHQVITSGQRLLCDRAAIEKAFAVARAKRDARKADGPGNRPGRPSDRRAAVVEAIKGALAGGEFTVDSLRETKQEFLAKKFGASRKTCDDARKIALALVETASPLNY